VCVRIEKKRGNEKQNFHNSLYVISTTIAAPIAKADQYTLG